MKFSASASLWQLLGVGGADALQRLHHALPALVALPVAVLVQDGLVLVNLGDGIEGGLELQAAVVIAAHDRSRLDQYLVPGLKVHGVHGGRINVLNNL